MFEVRSSTWLATLWLLASLGHVLTQDPLILTISRVSVTAASDSPPVEVCFSGGSINITDANQINLSCWDTTQTPPVEDSVKATNFTTTSDGGFCSVHVLTSAIYGKKLTCMLEVNDNSDEAKQEHGEAVFDMPAQTDFPDCASGAILTDQKLLGLLCKHVGDSGFKLQPEGDFTIAATSTNVSYYTTTATVPGTPVTLCKNVSNTVGETPATLQVCGDSIAVTVAVLSGTDNLTANLKYEGSKESTLDVTFASDCGSNTCDLLTKNGEVYVATTASEASVLSNNITRSNTVTDYLVVKYSLVTGFTKSQLEHHKDYEVKTTVIGTDILEIYWKRNTDADGHEDSPYKISYTKDGVNKIGDANVICVNPDVYCFGYFVDVEAGTYSVSVASADTKNVITLESVVIPTLADERYKANAVSLQMDTFIMTPAATPPTIEACYGTSGLSAPDKDNVHLTCSVDSSQDEFSSESTTVTTTADDSTFCSTHTIPGVINVLGVNLHCILAVNDGNQGVLGSAEVILQMPETLFDCISVFHMSDVNMMGMQCSAQGLKTNVVIDVATSSYTVLDVTDKTFEPNSYFLLGNSKVVVSITEEALICYQVNNDAAKPDVVRVCSSAGAVATATNAELLINNALVSYKPDGGELTVTPSSTPPDNYDILAIASSAFIGAENKDAPCKLTNYDRKTDLSFILVSGALPTVTYEQGSIFGYNMVAEWLSESTIEVNWINPKNRTPFTIDRLPNDDIKFNTAKVYCEDDDHYCYGYFTELTADTYTVTLTPVSGKESVKSEPITKTPAIKGLQVKEVHLDWSRDGVTVDASVCFHEDVAGEPKGPTEYRVVLVDAQGRWLRVQGPSKKTEGALCFSGATLDTRKFNTVAKVAVLVTRIGEDARTVLAHGEAHLFFITPETEAVGGRATLVSWGNPGGYTFTVRREGNPVPVNTSTTNRFVHYFVPRTTGPEVDRLVVETEALEVKMTVVVPLTQHMAADLAKLTVKYMTFPITKSADDKDVTALIDVECTTNVNDATSLSLSVIVPDPETTQYDDVVDIKGITQASTAVTFDHMNDDAFVPGPVTVVVAGHKDDVPVAFGRAQVTLRDPEDRALRVGKHTDESYEAFRISFSESGDDTGGAQLGYDGSCDCQKSPCYCLGSVTMAQEPQTFCLKLKNTAPNTGGTILQCNDKLVASNSDKEATVTSVKMTHKVTGTVDVAVDVTFDSQVELLVYESGDTTLHDPLVTCTAPGSQCTVSDRSINSDTVDYSILVVTTDGSSIVKESRLLAFEDYKTKVKQLTSDAMEVRFSAKTKTLYQVSVTPTDGTFSSKTVECLDNGQCTEYFFSMRTETEYEATVQQREGGDLNKVAVHFTMEPMKKSSRDATLELRDKENERLLTVCVDGQLPTPSDDYILVLINGLNNTIIEKGPLSKENRCFSEVSLDLQLSQQVKMMVLTDGEDTKVALETDVIILDPTSAISVTQVGSKALKATWSNRNPLDLEYEVGLTGAEDKVECKAQQECIEYIHLHSSTGATNVTIKENNDGTVQVVSVQVSPVTIPELTIISSSIQWDDRLRVCFNRTATADTYELGLEKDAVHLQTSVRAQVDTHATLETCIVSTDTVDVGAYVDLWMVVTAFDSSGVIVASGESTWNTILLSSSRNVRAAIMGTSIFTSWYLLDDPSTIDNFQVILRSSDSDSVFNVSNAKSTYTLTDQISGTYTVCVKALKLKQVPAGSTIASDEVCSDIIVLSSNNETIPDVEETNPKSTAKDAVLLTWQPPQNVENVSGYFVSWTSATSSAKRSPRRLPPQSLVRSHEELRQGVTGDGESDFVIVPATDTSVEVTHLQEGTQYTFCISSIVHDVVDQIPNCKDTNLGDFTPLYTPSLSSTSDGDLEWTDNNTGPVSFLVEWRSPSEEGHQEVNETSYHLQVTPGEWVVSVRTLNADSSSAPNTTTVPVKGVITTVTQEGSRKMVVTWSEEPTPAENNTYIVYILQDTDQLAEYTLYCYGDVSTSDCYYEFFLENELQRAVQLTVSVSIVYSQVFYNSTFTMEPISGVRSLAQTIRSSNEVVVEWQEVENAKYYQLSLYEDDSFSNRRWMKQQALPLRVTLQEDDMIGNVVVVQACTDDLHCGDATKITIQTQVPSSNSSVVGAVLGGVLGVTILACVIFFFVKRQQLKKKERRQLNCIESEQEMATKQYVYDEWGARRLGQPAVNTTPDNIS